MRPVQNDNKDERVAFGVILSLLLKNSEMKTITTWADNREKSSNSIPCFLLATRKKEKDRTRMVKEELNSKKS